MLAQNFKTAEDLGMTDRERGGLESILKMLETGELIYRNRKYPKGPNGFNMGCTVVKAECGTVACLAGWVEIILGAWIKEERMSDHQRKSFGELIMPERWHSSPQIYTVDRAAMALRNYLTHGEPRWAEALAT